MKFRPSGTPQYNPKYDNSNAFFGNSENEEDLYQEKSTIKDEEELYQNLKNLSTI